jgi:hypothetical protein
MDTIAEILNIVPVTNILVYQVIITGGCVREYRLIYAGNINDIVNEILEKIPYKWIYEKAHIKLYFF